MISIIQYYGKGKTIESIKKDQWLIGTEDQGTNRRAQRIFRAVEVLL